MIDGLGRDADRGEHEGELSDLEEPECYGQRDDVAIAKDLGERGKDEAFAEAHRQDQNHHLFEVVEEEAGIEQHPHRSEEEEPEQVPQRDDVAEGLVAIV